MNDTQLNQQGRQLATRIDSADEQLRRAAQASAHQQRVHIVGAGATVTAAYEQLRNATEYAEEHTLLQRAIRRFYRRLFLVRDEKQIKTSGEELAIELTLAGYLENDTVSETVVAEISQLAERYYAAYGRLQQDRQVPRAVVDSWSIDVLAVQIDWLLNNPALTSAYVQFVYEYYRDGRALEQLFDQRPDDLEAALYVAIQRALLKSDDAVIRAGLLGRYQQSPTALAAYIQTNRQIDSLFQSVTTEKLYRYIDRHGAPFRVLRHVIEEQPEALTTLGNPNEFLARYETQITRDYASINARINRGIIKSVIFLVITKVLIGLAIEIPYDYLVLGGVAVLPLLINLGFPPLYMVLLRMTLLLPGPANTRRLVDDMEKILYGKESLTLARTPTSFGAGFNIAYGVVFLLVFGGVGYLLWHFAGFDILHLMIFFLFLSGASFLGFRLSRLIREIEAVDSAQNAVTTVRDFLYMPFVVVGRYMSEKYSQINLVSLLLDMLIELPLKTILRLIRQWAAFISSKKDAL